MLAAIFCLWSFPFLRGQGAECAWKRRQFWEEAKQKERKVGGGGKAEPFAYGQGSVPLPPVRKGSQGEPAAPPFLRKKILTGYFIFGLDKEGSFGVLSLPENKLQRQ